ncbi:hypothetical protein ACO0LD_23945 [Undibacterium sp. Ji83W]|uniref:hypothetical protein n=1 Tax=Undibacterium sp. Ji83W TaxID=3413043 RepID=UPI003BEF8B8A
MMHYSGTLIFNAFFIFGLGYIWVKKPPIPLTSGKNAIWVKYESEPDRWRKYAVIFSFLVLLMIAFDLLRMVGK